MRGHTVAVMSDGDSAFKDFHPAGADSWSVRGEERPAEPEDPWSDSALEVMEIIEQGLQNDSVTEIHGYAYNKIGARYGGENSLLLDKGFADEIEYERFLKKMVDDAKSATTWKDIERERQGVVSMRNGERLCIFLPVLSQPWPTFSIRKHTAATWKPVQFTDNGTLDKRMMDFLQAAVAARVNILIVGMMGSGKAQPLDAKVLTPDGWTTMGDLAVGDRVIGTDGEAHFVTGVFPQGEKEIYRVTFSDGSSTECCDEHLWCVQRAQDKHMNKGWRVKALNELRYDIVDGAGNSKWFIPMVQPVNFPGTDLPLDPYLLGTLIGDGCLRTSTMLSTADEEILESARVLVPAGVEVRHQAAYDYRLSGTKGKKNPVTAALAQVGLRGTTSTDKFIPNQYKFSSAADRLALLQGLLDTDGGVKPGTNNISFSTSSEQLADDVIELVRSLGGRASKNRRLTHYTHNGEKRQGKPSYRLGIRLPAGLTPFRLSRKLSAWTPAAKYEPTRAIVSIERIGVKAAQCIAVDAPDHLYVTDDYIVTHNTSLLRTLAQTSFGDNERIAVVEQVPELFLTKPLTMQYVYQPTVEGLGLADVLDGMLYNSIQRLVVGEVHLQGLTKMLEVMILSEGSLSTYHAQSAAQAGERMKVALQMENPNMTAETAASFIRQAVELVVVLDVVEGKHRCIEITEVDWRSSGGAAQLTGRQLFTFDRTEGRFRGLTRPDEEGRIMHKARHKYGVSMPNHWFIDPDELGQIYSR